LKSGNSAGRRANYVWRRGDVSDPLLAGIAPPSATESATIIGWIVSIRARNWAARRSASEHTLDYQAEAELRRRATERSSVTYGNR